jgi:hypothetical protein
MATSRCSPRVAAKSQGRNNGSHGRFRNMDCGAIFGIRLRSAKLVVSFDRSSCGSARRRRLGRCKARRCSCARSLPQLCWGRWPEGPDGVWPAATDGRRLAPPPPQTFNRRRPAFHTLPALRIKSGGRATPGSSPRSSPGGRLFPASKGEARRPQVSPCDNPLNVRPSPPPPL